MKVSVNSMTQEEFEQYLMRVVACAFFEGMLYEKSGGKDFLPLSDAIKSAQLNIIVEGNL